MAERVVLLVEDERADQELMRRAMQETGVPHRFVLVDDGEEALAYLRREGRYADPVLSPRPDLVLLDLNLPKLDGHQVLVRMRADRALRRIPVVVLTTSQHEKDVIRCYEAGCNAYVQKPLDLDDLSRLAQVLASHWLEVVIAPPKDA